MRKTSLLLLCCSLVLLSCGGSSSSKESTSERLDSRDKIRLKQYSVQGGKLYATYCSSCHQADGKGLASLYPPLAESDYLLEDFARAACIVKNGLSEEIIVNGVSYNQMMPGNPITNLEIAEILTFVSNSWGNEAGLISVKDVNKWVENCE